MSKVDSAGEFGFFRLEGGSVDLPAKPLLFKGDNVLPTDQAEQLFAFTPKELKFSFVSVDENAYKALRRALLSHVLHSYAKHPGNVRLILKSFGVTVYDGKAIIKRKRSRITSIAGEKLNHGTH